MEHSTDRQTSSRAAAIAAIALLGPALGVATDLRAQAVLVLGTAALVVIAPPNRSPGFVWISLFLAVMCIAVTAFLPAGWIGVPEWRQALTANHRIDLPDTASPQPWLSFNAACLLFTGLVFALYLVAHPWKPDERRQAARIYAAGTVVLAAAAIIAVATGNKIPFWPDALNSPIGFGFFPNRNQTGNVLALGGIMCTALAFDSFERRRKSGLFWATSVVVLGAAAVMAYSRAGIILFFGGITAWIVVSFALSTSKKGVALGTAVVCLLLTGFFIFGGETLERFVEFQKNAPTDLRFLIHEDALRLSATAPWLGQGLGNFEAVFALARESSVSQSRAIHPESDWLWVAVEMGWPAAILLLGTFLFWMNQCFPFSTGTDRRVRSAAMVCGVAFAVHAGIDVSGHRPGSAWPALFLAALALHPDRRLEPRRWVAPLFRITGLLTAAIACWWIATIWSDRVGQIAPSSYTLSRLVTKIEEEKANAHFEAVHQLATEALRIAPLNSDLYFQRGVARVADGFSVHGAARDFEAARILQPHWANLCVAEGEIWLAVDQPEMAFDAWLEALRRAGAGSPYLYSQMLAQSSSKVALRAAIGQLAHSHPDFLLIFLRSSDRIETELAISRLLEEDPDLKSLSSRQRREIFAAWFQKGDRAVLISQLLERPEWMKDGWPWYAQSLAQQHQYESAYRTARQNGTAPTVPQFATGGSLVEMEKAFEIRPDDISLGLSLYAAQKAAGKIGEALSTLRALQGLRVSPPYVIFLEAELLAEQGRWEEAWKTWQRIPEPR